MDATVVSLDKGSRVWYKESETSWLLAEITSANQAAGAYDLQLTSSGKAVAGVPAAKLAPANPELQRSIPDLIQLSYLNEPSILCDLNERYQEDEVYTNAGPVLIAVNPCKMLPLYTQEVAHHYKGNDSRK
jgi:myosin-5